ncbi:MAG: enolase C-terminal domain-like protein [Candidatus Latescibacterota bacterium]|nr:enolase C-terminal domain-like protein [Candidatus Latescibacterota bacterium]
MKITDVKLYVLEQPAGTASVHQLIEVSNLRRIQYTHTSKPVKGRPQASFIEVQTDEGITGRCTCTVPIRPHQHAIIKNQVIGENPMYRERLFQMLQKGTRWVYQPPGWFGDFDNCLWDIAGKAAGLPVYSLIGKLRDRFPAYLTGGDMDVQGYLDHIEKGKQLGIRAYKFHSYKGGRADAPILREVRDAVGPDYLLLHDPVCSYDLREAIEIGHLMEELDFVWLEEPFHEQKMHHYQELCRELTIPVMANEMLMHDMEISSQWLIHGATDRLRGNARHGTTQVLKLAHFAELYDTNIELNGMGGLGGLIHATLGCCIDNTEFYEAMGSHGAGREYGLLNPPEIIDGQIAPSNLPGWGAEWDEELFRSLIVEEY